MRPSAGLASLLVVAGLLSGCSDGDDAAVTAEGEGAASAETSPGSPSPSPSRSPSPRPSPTSSPDSGSSASPDATDVDATNAPIVTGTSSAPQTLTLVDFFNRTGWDEGEVQVPRQQEPVQALTTELTPDYTGSRCENVIEDLVASPLELRLAAESGTVAFTVGQALDSATSDTLLDVKLLADNRTVETTTVPFAESRTLSTPVDGVSSVKLQVSVSEDSPSCSTTVVVRDVRLTGS